MTEQSQHRCTECKLAMRKEKIWWVCKRNCVQRNNTDVCIMKPDQFEKGSSFKTEREKVLELLDDLRRYANGEYKEADLSDNEHDLRIHLEYENRIWGIMQELRNKQGGEP